MILVDSSVWISYFRKDGSEKLKELIKTAIFHDEVVVNGIIIVEVLSGISRKRDFELVRDDFKGFHYIDLTERDFFEASAMGSKLRSKGISVPSTDLIIATSAIAHGVTLYHIDKHFDLISSHFSLRAKNLRNLL
jgi:predicted nucleic acid-binding protein